LRRLTYPDSARLGGWALAILGLIVLAVLLISRVWSAPFIDFGQRVIAGSDLAQAAFGDGGQFWSYEAGRLLQFGFMLLGSGLVLLLALSPFGQRTLIGAVDASAEEKRLADQDYTWSVGLRVWHGAALLLLVLDLWLIGFVFNPRVNPSLLEFRPPAVEWLTRRQLDQQPWRFTTFQLPDEQKTYNANLGMWDWNQDVRGYDSIIPKQYAEYMSQLQTQGDLLYNRIAPIYAPNVAALDDPLFDLLGVRYVVTTQEITNPGYWLAYDGEVKIYENVDAVPRALFVPQAAVADEGNLWDVIRSQDLRQTVVLDEASAPDLPDAVFGEKRDVRVSSYGLNGAEVEVDVDAPGWLVLNDAHFTGWRAYIRPLAAVDEGAGINESELPIYRANGNFRAVYVAEPGWYAVRFHYTPMSFKLGLYASFLAAIFLLLLVGWWAWGRYYRETEGEGAHVRRVAKNSLVPMSMSIVNKFIDYAFALLYLRILNPAGVGAYTFAVQFYTLFEIIVRFGLGTLLTRELARKKDADNANQFLGNVIVLRTILWAMALPVMAFVTWLYWQSGSIDNATVLAIGIFALALFFSNLSDAFSSTFNAYEQMEYPATVASFMAVARVALGALVLVIGWGFVGLALVSLVMNIVQSIWLYALLRKHLLSPHIRTDWKLQRWMLGESYPLMLNNLLATAFWRIDVLILTAVVGVYGVGLYSAAYKYIDGLNVIPSYFTLAIFPVMSRFASDSPNTLLRTYKLALRLLTIIAIPIAVAVFFLAGPLILILGGTDYIPGSVILLRILVLSIPIGFINSVTHYVLIAVGQQRFLTRAFIFGVIFNTVGNLIFIPRYGAPAAAVITIMSEFALLFPFYYAVRKHVAKLPWFDLLWRQALAGALMAATFVLVGPFSLILATLLAGGVYLLGLVITGAHKAGDMEAVWAALPLGRLRGVIGGGTAG
ncbi:MAG: flippase, partial [Caldilineales bacterium]|nr:flippase [Caldilineales bacterium]